MDVFHVEHVLPAAVAHRLRSMMTRSVPVITISWNGNHLAYTVISLDASHVHLTAFAHVERYHPSNIHFFPLHVFHALDGVCRGVSESSCSGTTRIVSGSVASSPYSVQYHPFRSKVILTSRGPSHSS